MSKDTISKITDKVIKEMTEWQSRLLKARWCFIDAIVRQAVLCRCQGYHGRGARHPRDVGRRWRRGTKSWLGALTKIKNRGVEDVYIVACYAVFSVIPTTLRSSGSSESSAVGGL